MRGRNGEVLRILACNVSGAAENGKKKNFKSEIPGKGSLPMC